MSEKINEYINATLLKKVAATHCPGCKRRIKRADLVAALGYWTNTSPQAPYGSNNFYPVCHQCLPEIALGSFTDRCEKRITRNPYKYTLTIFELLSNAHPFVADDYVVGTGFADRDPWVAADRDWFAANPARTHRIRRPFSGEVEQLSPSIELSSDDYPDVMVVTQFEPGHRVRRGWKGNISSADIQYHNEYDERIMQLTSEDFIHEGARA